MSHLCSLLAVITATLGILPAPAQADTLTVRFSGTVDLTEFGASSTSAFRGDVSWDPELGSAWVPVDPGCPDFCLDGSFGAVSATFTIDSIDYTGSIDPISRFIVWGFGGISLDLYFTPLIDLDGGAAPDLRLFSLNLFSDPPDDSILIDSELPDDLAFLSHLNMRSAFFSDLTLVGFSTCMDPFTGTCATPDTLTVVAEPASTALLLVGLSAATLSVRRRRGHSNGPRSTQAAAGSSTSARGS